MSMNIHFPLLTVQNAPLDIILANGEFPKQRLPLDILCRAIEQPQGRVICTDGSVQKLLAFGVEPDAVVGDLDSMSASLRERLSTKLHHQSEQESNDLSKAVRYLKANGGCTKGLCILGAAGGREDHLLGNVSLLPSYTALLQDDVIMLTDHGYFRSLRAGSYSCEVHIGQQISFFSLMGGQLSVDGMKWPLRNAQLQQLWQGSLNQATDSLLRIHCDASLVIYFANEQKVYGVV